MSRSYCFTSFEEKLDYNEEKVRYMIYGREICPDTGKNHLQGYVEFNTKMRVKGAQDAIGDCKAHMETRKGTRDQAREYCMKDGNYTEIGDWEAGGQGHRTDLKKMNQRIKNGETNLEICESTPNEYAANARYIEAYRAMLEEKKNTDFLKKKYLQAELNDFQEEALIRLQHQGERKILWICDRHGGAGKSWFSKWLVANKSAFRCSNGKTADIAYNYKGEEYFIMDLSRSLETHVNYDVIEQIKNGMIFSTKYASRQKVFPTPKVLILANFMPDESMLSEDRWDIWELPSPNE